MSLVVAEFIIRKNISGNCEILFIIINSPPKKYIPDIVGTSLDAVLPILSIPPKITRATNIAIITPMTICEIPNSINKEIVYPDAFEYYFRA